MGNYCQLCGSKSTSLHPCKIYQFKYNFEGIEFEIEIHMHESCIKNSEYNILEFSS